MTTEQKAKAYDEAVNKLRRFMTQGVDPLITRADVQDFFPELAESEDERIRKGIKSILEHYKESGEVVCPYPFVSIDEALTWLEKQGNKNTQVTLPTFTFEDVLTLECSMKTAKITKDGDKLYEMLVRLYDKIHNAYLLEKQGQCQVKESAISQHENKTCKENNDSLTSKDDMMIEETLYFLREYQQSNRCKDENGMQNSVSCEKWLKSLKERIGG